VASGFRIATAYVVVSPDTEDFAEQLEADVQEATEGVEGKVKIGADKAELDAALDEAKADVDEFDGKTATAKLGADDDEFTAKMDSAEEKLGDFDGRTGEAELLLADDDFTAKMDEADDRLDDMDGKSAHPRLDLDDDDFQEKLQRDKQQLNEANSESGEGSMLGGIAIGLGSIMPGIGGATAGLGLLAGTGALAFSGVAKALEAAHESSENVGMTNAQMASQDYSNSVQIQQSQESVTQAREQAAQDAISSAQSIEQADMNLASTERNAAASQIEAIQSVEQAQQQVQQSTYNLSEAQYNLGQAYVSARQAIVQENDALADAKLNVASASLAVQQAEYNQLLVDQNAYSTDLDREQAALAVSQAKQQVTDATANETDAQTAANLADSQGVNGSQAVIQAKQALLAAQDSLTDALQSYTDAQRNLTDTELNGAQQVKEAQLQVASAQEQAAYQAKMDAQSVAEAELNLTETIREQKLEWASMLSTSNSSANEFAKYMAALSPAGRNFVNEVLSMRGAFKDLETAAQNAVLPGFTVFLTGISDLLPSVQSGISQMGSAISQAFAGFGQEMQAPGAQKVLQGLISNGIQFANIVLPAFATFIGDLFKLGSAPGAVSGLAGLFAGIGRGLAGMVTSLKPWIPSLNSFLKAAGNVIAAIGPPLANIIGLVAGALRPLTSYLDKHPNGTVVKILGDVAAGLITIKGLQKILPDFITGPLGKLGAKSAEKLAGPFKDIGGKIAGYIGNAMSSAAGSVATFVSGFVSKLGEAAIATGTWIAEHTVATAAFITENVAQAASATAAFIAENAATLGIAGAITALVGVAIYLGTHWKQVWGDVQKIGEDAWNFIYNGFGKYLLPLLGPVGLIALGAIELYQHWQTIWGAIQDVGQDFYNWIWSDFGAKIETFFTSTIPGWWDTFWSDTRSVFNSGVSDLGRIWSTLENVFKSPVNFLINTVYDDGILKLWNSVVDHIGLGSIALKPIGGLAHGGVVPGYNPGHDTEPAMLSKGEAVLTPDATKAIGGSSTVNALNKAYPPSGGGHSLIGKEAGKQLRKHLVERPAEHAATLGTFSGGGIAGDIGSAVGDVGSAIGSVVSGAADAGKLVAALATGNTTAMVNALGKFVSTDAAGDLAKVMLGVPKTLAGDMVKSLVGLFAGSGGSVPSGGSNAMGSLPQNWHAIASYLFGHGATKYAAAGIAGNITAESGGDPEILEVGGGGGGGLIQWTPWQAYGPLITGNASQDLMTQLAEILSFGGGLGVVNKATSPSNAALIYQDDYERPASDTASLATRMSSANAVAHAMGWGSYDSGGELPPGPTLMVNGTGQPERVLDPQQSQAFETLVNHLTSGASGGSSGPAVIQNYYGPQMPGQEQTAEMNRQLALALGGGT
jgi:hypothetical protein